MKINNVLDNIIEWSISRGINRQEPNRNAYIANKVEELGEYAEAFKKGNMNDVIDAIVDSMVFDITELGKHNIDPTLALKEVLKVLNSRVGDWDKHTGKFIKDTSDYAKSLWYDPNYLENCKSYNNE